MSNLRTTTMAEAQTEMPVHETLEERLAEAETQEERSEIVRAWIQEEIDHKRDIFELFD